MTIFYLCQPFINEGTVQVLYACPITNTMGENGMEKILLFCLRLHVYVSMQSYVFHVT